MSVSRLFLSENWLSQRISLLAHIVHGTMNNMRSKPKSSDVSLRELSLSIGDFIRYWGFRRVHGAIWTQLYLSIEPLNCTELAERLGLSKALISPALDELCQYKLITEAPAPNEKTKVYRAAEDVNEVIRRILRERESKILKQITKNFANFKKDKDSVSSVQQDRVKSLEEMILAANFTLEMVLSQKDLTKSPIGLDA
jgi:DNA-binding transcriptional regulator GbsR (MarR family)